MPNFYAIELAVSDKNGVNTLLLGALAWNTQQEQIENWSKFQTASIASESKIIAKLMDLHGKVKEEKTITKKSCEEMLGQQLGDLVKKQSRYQRCSFEDIAEILDKVDVIKHRSESEASSSAAHF